MFIKRDGQPGEIFRRRSCGHVSVTVESGTGERAVWRLTEILPHAFGPSNLGK